MTKSEKNTAEKENTFLQDQKRFLAYAAPTCMLIVSPFGLSFVSIMFAGWQNKELLAGVALGNTTYNIFLMSVMCGFCSLLSTYGPQVYGNPATQKQLGTVVQKVFLISFTVYMIVLGPYMKSLKIISWVIVTITDQIGKHNMTETVGPSSLDKFSTIQDTAEEFITKTWSWGLLDFSMRLVTKYLSLQYHSTAVYCCTGVLITLHVILTHLFTIRLDMGLQGLVLGGTLSRVISLAVLLLYCYLSRKKLAWAGFTTGILNNWKEMIVLGISASVNVFSEMGMYELAIFLSQFRGVNYLSTVVISFQIITLIYSTTYGVCYAAAAMIGTALGEGDCPKVKRYMRLCLGNTIVESVLLAVLGYYFRFQLAGLFTDDSSVISETAGMLWILLIEVPLDHVQSLFSYGILVTVGSQLFVASALAIICYGICTPAIACFIFLTPLNGVGVLYGMLTFVALSCIVCGLKISRLDLAKEVREAQLRAKSSIAPLSGEEACLVAETDESDESLLEETLYEGHIKFFSVSSEDVFSARDNVKKNSFKAFLISGLAFSWLVVGFISLVL